MSKEHRYGPDKNYLGSYADILSQENGAITKTATIKTIAEVQGQKGSYHKVTFEDGKSVNVFNAKQLEGLTPGMSVEYGIKKNDKGFWNLTDIVHKTEPELSGKTEQLPPAPAFSKERQMASMNALTAAKDITAAILPLSKEGMETRPLAELSDLASSYVKKIHAEFLALHHEPGETKP